MHNRKQKTLIILMWFAGTVIVILSLAAVFPLLIGAALGPIENAWLIGPLVGCFLGAVLVFYAFYKTIFDRKWIQIIVFVVFILPLSGLGLITGSQAAYVAAMPIFEETKIIKRDILFEHGWHFINSNYYAQVSDKKVHRCIKNLGTKRLVATLEITLHYGKVSYFRVLKYGECKVQFPIEDPNLIVPAYTRGEENSEHT